MRIRKRIGIEIQVRERVNMEEQDERKPESVLFVKNQSFLGREIRGEPMSVGRGNGRREDVNSQGLS
jgi:hypothetical protein